MHIRDQNTQITQSSPDPNKHTAKRVTSNRSPRDHCIENQEREEAINLLTTDPKVYNELLTHHWRGTNEDDEPLCDGV